MSAEEESPQEEVPSEDFHPTVNGETVSGDDKEVLITIPVPASRAGGKNLGFATKQVFFCQDVRRIAMVVKPKSQKAAQKPIANGREPAPTPEEVEEAEQAIKKEAAKFATSPAPPPYYTPLNVSAGAVVIIGSITALVHQLTKKPKSKTEA